MKLTAFPKKFPCFPRKHFHCVSFILRLHPQTFRFQRNILLFFYIYFVSFPSFCLPGKCLLNLNLIFAPRWSVSEYKSKRWKRDSKQIDNCSFISITIFSYLFYFRIFYLIFKQIELILLCSYLLPSILQCHQYFIQFTRVL